MKRRKTQVEHVDYDYLDKLSVSELAWLQEFTNSYYSGGKGPLSKGDGAERDNAARRDIFNRHSRTGLNDGIKEMTHDGSSSISERLADWSDDSAAAAIKKRREGYQTYLKRTRRDSGKGTKD